MEQDATNNSSLPPQNRAVVKPLLIYDGDCGFCRFWVDSWQKVNGDKIDFAPFQEVASDFPTISNDAFNRSVQLVEPDGKNYSGAEAVFRVLANDSKTSWMLACYRSVPGFAFLSEWFYQLVAGHRQFFSKVTVALWGKAKSDYWLSRWLFLRLLGIIYCIAFLSLGSQVLGLIGSKGILPAQIFLNLVSTHVGPDRYYAFPTLAWLNSSDIFLQFLCTGGAILSLLAAIGIATGPALALCFLFYLSLVTIGGDFLSFQWDALLLEVGFLSIFLAPWVLFEPPWKVLSKAAILAAPSIVIIWLLRIVLFKLTFMSGAVKLLSGDPTYRDLTALTYHWWTQPLPMPFAWYMDKLPLTLQKASEVVMFVFELLVPLLIFTPRKLRLTGCVLTIFFQLMIILTGNYTFFNWLAIALCVLLVDDAALRGLIPGAIVEKITEESGNAKNRARRLFWIVPIATVSAVVYFTKLVIIFIGVNLITIPGLMLVQYLEPLRLMNDYGVFAVMTTSRREIIVEGSRDGENWLDYEFKYKPGNPKYALPVVAPLQPRLDWQMWFAALGSADNSPWFANFLLRLLEGSPDVLKLLRHNPFPDAPPKYIRAVTYDYHFTTFEERQKTGNLWRRDFNDMYFPPTTLGK